MATKGTKKESLVSSFEQFTDELAVRNLNCAVEGLTPAEQMLVGGLYSNVISFISSNHMAGGVGIEGLGSFGKEVPHFNSEVSLNEIGIEQIMDLVISSGIEKRYQNAAAMAVGHCIVKYSSESIKEDHFETRQATPGSLSSNVMNLNSIFSNAAISRNFMGNGMESFGKDINRSITDAKIAIAVTLLKFHKSIINRLIPNHPQMENVVLFNVENLEVYDLAKSRNVDSEIRLGDHITPFIDLYKNPTPANTAAKPIVLLTANDSNPAKLYAENMPFIGQTLNMFDYALNVGQIGYSHIDFTDLVNEGGKVKAVVLKLDNGTPGDEEYVYVPVLGRRGNQFLMASNTVDSAERVCAMRTNLRLNAATLQHSGVVNTLIASLTADAFIEVGLNIQGRVNLRTSEIAVLGSCENTLKTVSGTTPINADANIMAAITVTVVAFEGEFQYSEENVRKTSTALRILNRTLGYEIPGAKSVITQFSLGQARPETVINSLSQLIAIGNDDRAVNLILDSIDNVYDRLQEEKSFPEGDYAKKVLNDFVAGHLCKPAIYRSSKSLSEDLANMRSGDIWGDLRTLAEKFILEVITRINQESLYMQALEPGEKQEFNVLTSGYILNALLSVPHYHKAFGDGESNGNVSDGMEFRRVLPNGAILNIITTNFTYMQDRMLMLPVRPSKPNDPLNFATNVDLGTFVAQVVPNVDGSISKQVIANGREFPIVTNPVAILIEWTELSKVFDGIASLGIS